MWSAREDPIGGAPDSDRPGDRSTMERLRRGDPDALETLLRHFWQPVVGYAGWLLGGGADPAEDLAQEAFVRLWERRKEWKEDSLPAPLLYLIVRGLALNERRNRSTRRSVLQRLAADPRPASPTPEDELAARDLGDTIRRALARLPERRREILVLARYHGLSHREIAQVMGISAQTVANQMSAALTEMRSLLQAYRHPVGGAGEPAAGPTRPPAAASHLLRDLPLR